MDNNGLQQYLNKPTAAVHIRNSFTATERKLVNICLHEGLKDNFSQDQYAIDIWHTLELLGCEKSKNSAWLKDELFDALRAKPIKWNVLKKDSKLQEWTCSFLSGYVYEPEDGKLAFQFNPIAAKQFQQRRLYSRLLLQIQAPIKSGHALTLYEYLNDELQRQKDNIEKMLLSLNDFRLLLDIGDGQYPEFKHFNQRAIKPAFKEINEHTDVEASYDFVRENRSIVALCITAKRQKSFQLSLNLNAIEAQAHDLNVLDNPGVQLLMVYGITKNKAMELVEKVPIDQIVANVKYTLNRQKDKKVQNFPSYLIKAINEGYATVADSEDQQSLYQNKWEIYRQEQAIARFTALPFQQQQELRSSYEKAIECELRTLARDKFRNDGGWNSRFIERDFLSKVMLPLLETPAELELEAFKAWWPEQELKNLLTQARKDAKAEQKMKTFA